MNDLSPNRLLGAKQNWGSLDVKPDFGEMIKPHEAIDIVGIEGLTLHDKRCFNTLIANAFGSKLREEDRDFTISVSELRSNHNSNERVEDTIERLMKTIARHTAPNGSVTRFQLLGGNNMGDPMRPRGELTYSFDRRMIKLFRDSVLFGKLELQVMAAFNSKYALSLYEHMTRFVNLRSKWSHEFSVEEFRDVLGVGKSQLKVFGNLKARAIVPAVREVNAWAPFTLTLAFKKTGQKVTGIDVHWIWKDKDNRQRVRIELEKSKHGRKARMTGLKETVIVLEGGGFDPDEASEASKL